MYISCIVRTTMKSRRGTGPRITNEPFILTFAILLIFPSCFTQHADDHFYVEPTPALKLTDEDLTTVLLVSNDNRTENHGRFLNVRPAVGLLTSTARTFIQEGVTTEYATQVLGTTLENGRLYAQLLKKSSRVLYDKENIISSPSTGGTVHTSIVGEAPHNHVFANPKLLLQSHNDLVADKDWQDVDDSLILEKNSFVVNTDYIATAPKVSNIVYPVKATNHNKNEFDSKDSNGLINNNFSSSRGTLPNEAFRIKANKVRPSVDLPTFTVKNMFSPSGFSWESPSDLGEQLHKPDSFPLANASESRLPKLLYHKIMKEERRPLSTVTYYGFADFTTIVGDSVIVFSPSTSKDQFSLGHVTSIKGEATLGHQEASYVSNIAITIHQDLIEPTFVVPMLSTNLNDLQTKPKDMRDGINNAFETMDIPNITPSIILQGEEKVTDSFDPIITKDVHEFTLTTHTSESSTESTPVAEVQIEEETTTTIPSETEENEFIPTTTNPISAEDVSLSSEDEKGTYENVLASSMSEINSLESAKESSATETTTRVMLSRPSDEEILQIFSSLASVEAAEKASRMEIQNLNVTVASVKNEAESSHTQISVDSIIVSKITTDLREEIQPETKVEGGATTIFFEDDPFLDFISPNSVHLESSQGLQSSTVVSLDSSTETISTDHNKSEENVNDTTEPIPENDNVSNLGVTEEIETNGSSATVLPPENEAVNEDGKESELSSQKNDVILESSTINFKPIIQEITENEEVEGCIRTSQVFLTQVPKTLTYYTTYFLPDEKDGDTNLSSIETNIIPSFDIAEATKHYCIQPTQTLSTIYKSEESVLERPSKMPEANITNGDDDSVKAVINTTSQYSESEKTEKPDELMEMNYEDDEDEDEEEDEDDQESGEEIELIYKTLFTTYTYLTTFFHDSTTSVSSRKEVVTNIITSSLDIESSTSTEYTDINPTQSISRGIGSSSSVHDLQSKSFVQSSDLKEIDGILRQDSNDIKPTAHLNDNKLAKTYYTTYTYYTTIFVDGETEVMSRTEVHTNVVGTASDGKISPSARNLKIDETINEEDNAVIKIKPTSTYEAIIRTPIILDEKKSDSDSTNEKYKTFEHGIKELESSSSSSSSRTEKKIVQLEDDSLRVKTDMHSSNSNSELQIYENGVLEDQLSSESNREEIIPSATLLLQTSFTTFTYYTTMYTSDTTNVVSRLETITNIVTETLQPTKTLNIEEATLPITYFTTFTYWTKLAKDGDITTLSREETISNIFTPSISESNQLNIEPTTILKDLQISAEPTEAVKGNNAIMTETTALQALTPTTYYTTYTYYTTSYAGNQTITNSRFETVTNVVTPSNITNLSPSIVYENNAGLDNKELGLESISSTAGTEMNAQTIAYDYKTIVDADEVSTLYFKTVVLATQIDGTSKEITSSTSNINIDEVKKATLSKSISNPTDSTRNYKIGLVRLIEGTEFLNHTTTVYQSKVIGTIIDDRYAQIIESTSSFIIEKTQMSTLQSDVEVSPSSTLSPTEVQATELVVPTSTKSLESSISDPTDEPEQDQENEDEEDDESDEDEGNDRKRTRLSFQTKKRTFTPVIRPFASRNRPQFAPKRKNLLQSSATIITRSDFTPTITATPALKSDARGRFATSRKSSAAFSAGNSFSSGGKRFGRPSKTSQIGGFGSSASFSSSRNRLQSSRTQGLSSGFGGGYSSSRRSGVSFRAASTNTRLFSSAFGGNPRLRIRPSSSLPFDSVGNTGAYTTLPPDSEEEGVTQKYDSNEETDVTTENARRNNNPLLRFRRPPVSRPPFQPGQRNTPSNQTPTRRLSQSKSKPATPNNITTTTRPRPRTFQRPTIGQIQNRPRTQGSLFPPRRLFQPQNINQALDEEQKSGDDFDDENAENNSAEYENDTDLDENEAEDSKRRRRESLSKLKVKQRSKRQADSSIRNNFRNRFRRPTSPKPSSGDRTEEFIDEEPSTVRSRTTSRFTPRSHTLTTSTHASSKPQSNSRSIRPTKPNSNNRAQFTLREKDTTPKLPSRPSNFRRPTPNGISSRRTTTAASRPKAPRLKSYGTAVTESSHSSPRGRSSTSRTRATTRGRNRNEITPEVMIPVFDGTITVTHVSPTEITIPVVNGKVTEYKNIVTTTTSTEVIMPNQYTTLLGQNGASTLVLNREETSINTNGATEITQFILQESLTTTVIFTPTTIRGRKTSFAHVIPSTVYQVENIVSTMQANIAASAPLANILLSQLLLGNIGLNQPNINPLLALGGTQPISQPAATPVTEYKTRTSTYVTTVTNGMSTVIPLTFHGKEILTTIFDTSSNVITATEYFTDTIVVTPTQQAHAQVNSLLLPLLLQQQLQGQSQIQPSLPIQHSIPTQLLLSDNLQELDSNGIQKYNDYNQDIDEYSTNQDEVVQGTQEGSKSNGRKSGRKFNKQQLAPTSTFESSVITLYVSGRRPGEFSTVLSTVQIGGDSSLYKRQINRAHSQAVLKSESADFEDFYRSDGSEIQEYLLPAKNEITTSQVDGDNFLSEKTQSLESIVGDVSLWYAVTSSQLEGPYSTTIEATNGVSTKTKLETSQGESFSTLNDVSSQPKYFLV